jgi:hypothetical protein
MEFNAKERKFEEDCTEFAEKIKSRLQNEAKHQSYLRTELAVFGSSANISLLKTFQNQFFVSLDLMELSCDNLIRDNEIDFLKKTEENESEYFWRNVIYGSTMFLGGVLSWIFLPSSTSLSAVWVTSETIRAWVFQTGTLCFSFGLSSMLLSGWLFTEANGQEEWNDEVKALYSSRKNFHYGVKSLIRDIREESQSIYNLLGEVKANESLIEEINLKSLALDGKLKHLEEWFDTDFAVV